jgi:hypothetical protein
MKIANVIHENELVNHTQVDYINYINKPTEYDKLNKSFPTLYVGWSFMKSCNPSNSIIQNADILKKKIITNELYWEFSFQESKASHVKGVDNFVNLAPQFYFQPKYVYTNLDPVFFQIKDVDDLLDVLPKEIDAMYNYKNDMIYLLRENKIWGVDLKMYQFFKFSISDIFNRLNDRVVNIHEDLSGDIYISHYKIFPNFIHLRRYLVTILSK